MNKQILVIEDDDVCFEMLREILNEYDLFPVRSCKLAMTIIETKQPDLILLDLTFPDGCGYDILEKMRSHPIERVRTCPIIVLTADNDDDSIAKCFEMGADGHIIKPFQPAVIRAMVVNQLKLLHYRNNLSEAVFDQAERLRAIYTSMINTFSLLVGQRDGSTGNHIINVTRYMAILMRNLDNGGRKWFPEEDTEYVTAMSALHDIGKISISDTILCKNGPLSEEEFAIMQSHPLRGGEILREAQQYFTNGLAAQLTYGVEMAEAHHERFDGSGYPYGLKGEEIPYSARVLHLCDVYEALTANRYYKRAYSHAQAFDILVNGDAKTKPEHFDPHVLRAFIRAENEFKTVLEGSRLQKGHVVRGADRRKK